MDSLRLMEPKDLIPLHQMAAAQNRRDGTNYPVPKIFELDPSKPGYAQLVQNVPLALVAENHGRVRQVFICTRTIEVMGYGGGGMDFSAAHIPMMADLLKRKGYEDLHTFVPTQRATEAHCKLLEAYGLARLDNKLAHFFKEL